MSFERFFLHPLSESLENAFKRSFVLFDDHHWGKDRLEVELSVLAPNFQWIARKIDINSYLIDAPLTWLTRIEAERKIRLGSVDFDAQPWGDDVDEGFNLKSVWTRLLGFPMKLWTEPDFIRFIEDFGILLEIDAKTRAHIDFTETRIRIGVINPNHIPGSKNVIFQTGKKTGWCNVLIVRENGAVVEVNRGRIKRARNWQKRYNPSDRTKGIVIREVGESSKQGGCQNVEMTDTIKEDHSKGKEPIQSSDSDEILFTGEGEVLPNVEESVGIERIIPVPVDILVPDPIPVRKKISGGKELEVVVNVNTEDIIQIEKERVTVEMKDGDTGLSKMQLVPIPDKNACSP